jgi:hypothetical protein
MRILAVTFLSIAAAPLAAQQTTDSAAPAAQGYAPAPPPSSRTTPASTSRDASQVVAAIVLPDRSDAVVQRELLATQDDLRRADARLTSASERRSRGETLAQQRRLQLREIEAKLKQADKEKRKADKSLLEAEKRTVERQQRWADQLKAVDAAEFEAAMEARRAAVAERQALELELQLGQKRAERKSNPTGGSGSDVVLRELERQTLEAQRDYRRHEHELARREEDTAKARLDLYRTSVPETQ